MRLSEKTVELNICAQITAASKKRIIWFGLTQAQEARAGFDAAARLGGRLMIFQFKASNNNVGKLGARRFSMEHSQLEHLIRQASSFRRSVFYAFPLIGNTQELALKKGNFLNETYLLDVSYLNNPYPAPTKKGSATIIRKNNTHHADVIISPAPKVIIHSEERDFSLVPLASFVENGFRGFDGLGFVRSDANELEEYDFLRQLSNLPINLRKGMKGLIIL